MTTKKSFGGEEDRGGVIEEKKYGAAAADGYDEGKEVQEEELAAELPLTMSFRYTRYSRARIFPIWLPQTEYVQGVL